MYQIAGITVGSILFVVITVAVVILSVLAILTPVFIYLINLRVKELLQEQRKSNFNLNEEMRKNNERIEELQKTLFLLLSEQQKITSALKSNINQNGQQTFEDNQQAISIMLQPK